MLIEIYYERTGNEKVKNKEGINMEFSLAQKRIIKSKPNGIKVIKGEKGCGKTFAAINRAVKLQQSYCAMADDEILIMAKDNRHIRSLKEIHEKIINKSAIQKSFFDEENKRKLEMNDINSLILLYFQKYNDLHKTNYLIAAKDDIRKLMKTAVKKVKETEKEFKKVKFLHEEYIEFFIDEIKWIKECCFLKQQDYLEADRSSRVNYTYGKKEKNIKLRKNSTARKCVFKIMNEYNRILKSENLVDFEDAAMMAAKVCRRKKSKKYTHIVIDEAEKFTRIEFEIMDILCNKKAYSSITFVLDDDKLENSSGWINRKRKFSSLGYNIKGKTVTLKEKFIYGHEIDIKQKDVENLNKAKAKKKHKKKMSEKDAQYPYSLIEFDFDKIKEKYVENVNSVDENSMKSETVKYIDLSRNVCHEFICDFYESGEVYTSDDNFKEKVEDVVNIPVFNEIAAGSPIYMNDEIEYSCNIPKDWVRSSKDLFILKIKGDSMVNKNINDGDHVLIKKGRYPSSNDIVAVEIEGEATLKTFKTKGKQIILKPENDKYDPIILTGEQKCSILGVAIGILKNFS